MSKYEFDLSVGIKEVLDADAAQKVESQMEAQRARFEEPIKIQLSTTDAKKRFKELEKEAKKVQKSLNKAISSKDFDSISKYTRQMSNVQREQKELLAIIGKQTEEIVHQTDVMKTADTVEKRRKKTTQGITAATEDMVEVLQEQARAIKEVEKAEARLQKTRQRTQKVNTAVNVEQFVATPIKLTKKKNDNGSAIPQTYTASDGRFRIEKGTVGWNVYDEHGKGKDATELFAQYDTLKDLKIGLAEFLREELVGQKKLNDAVKTQVKTTEKLAEARLKLMPKKESGYTVPETYVSEDGKFEVSKGRSGWDVYQRDNAGMYDLIATYKHLDDVRKDSSLLAREEIVYTDEIVEGLHTLQAAYGALGYQVQGRKPVIDAYLDLLIRIKSGALSATDAMEQFNSVIGNAKPKQQDTSSNDILAKANILAEFTQLSGQLALQHVGTEKYDAIVGKIEEINNGIINTGVSLEDATKQLNEFISDLKNANVATVHTQAIDQIPQLVDNYGKELDEVNNKLMQGTTLLSEQAQVLRLFHNSSEIFDTFDVMC